MILVYFRTNCETICHLPTAWCFPKHRKSLFKYRSWFSDPSVVVVVVRSHILYMLLFFSLLLLLLLLLFGVFIVFTFFTINWLPKIGVTSCFALILAPYITQSSHSILFEWYSRFAFRHSPHSGIGPVAGVYGVWHNFWTYPENGCQEITAANNSLKNTL